MPTYVKSIIFQVDYESNVMMHGDLSSTITTMFMSLPGVMNSFPMVGGEEIHVNHGTYISYSHDEYLRLIRETRLKIEKLNEQYTENKNMYEVL